MRKKRFDLAVLLAAGGFYLVNRLWLSRAAGGPAGWFLSCYANDIFAGAAIVAWTDLLLRWGRLPPVRSWQQTAPLLLACGLVWDVVVEPPSVLCRYYDPCRYSFQPIDTIHT